MRRVPLLLPLSGEIGRTDDVGLRDRKKRQVREAIADAALHLFAADGYDATTVQKIAERADVSPATVARYFPTKESMLFVDREVKVTMLRAAMLARATTESPLQTFLGAIENQPPLTEDERGRLLRSRQAIARSAVLRGLASGLLEEWRDGIASAFVERGDLEPEPARVLATALLAVLDDITDRWAADGGRGDFQEMVRQALILLDAAVSRSG